jgi:hypothetical protein
VSNKKVSNFLSAIIVALLLPFSCFTVASQNYSFSGFGQLVLGHLDEKHADYQGYDNGWSIKPQTLFGLQGEVRLSDSISVNSQLVGFTNSEKASGIEWLYVSYHPNDNFQLKIGRNKTPFFNFSDVKNVGFAYHWATPPQQVYSSYMFDFFDGVFARYDIPNKTLSMNIEAYWGTYEGEYNGSYNVEHDEVTVDVNDLRGLIFNVNYERLSARASLHHGDGNVKVARLSEFVVILEQTGFSNMAKQLSLNGGFNFYQFSVAYEQLDYFVRSEFTQAKPNLFVVPEINARYLSVGLNRAPFVFHATYADSKIKYQEPINEIPLGINPQLDALHLGFEGVLLDAPKDNLRSLTVGTRWDFKTNLAVKFDVTFLDADKDQNGFFTDIEQDNFDRRATLIQLAVTWVF